MKKLIILTMLLFAMPVFATVSDGESIRQSFTTNGSTTTFTFTFKCNSSDDVFVYSPVILTGLPIAPLVEDTDYTIAPTGGSYLNGGVVTIDPALAATVALRIVRRIKQSQETSSGAITPATIVAALDKLTRQVQDAEDRKGRSLHIPDSDSVAFDMTIPNAIDRAGKNLGFDGNGNVTVVDSSGTFTTINAFWDSIITKSPWADVTAFGADKTGTSDSSTAVQAALDSLTTEIGTLFFPPGTYKVNNITFSQTDDLQDTPKILRVIGYGATLLNEHTSNPTFLANFSDPYRYGLRFEGFYMDGNNEDTKGFDITGCPNIQISRVTVFDHQTAGIHLVDCWSSRMEDVTVSNPFGDVGVVGIVSEGAGGNAVFIGVKVLWCDTGFTAGRMVGGGFFGCDFSSNTFTGLNIQGGNGGVVHGCYFENNGIRDIYVGSLSEYMGISISGCRFLGKAGSTEAIRLERASGVTIRGCYSADHDNFIRGAFDVFPMILTEISNNAWFDTNFSTLLLIEEPDPEPITSQIVCIDNQVVCIANEVVVY